MSHKFTPEERLTLARLLFWSPLDVESAPIEEVKAAVDKLSKDLVKTDEANQRMTDLINTEDFQALEVRMIASTPSERALFTSACQLGRNKSNMAYFERLVWAAETPWRQQLQIDKDYAKYCADLDNRPTFLSWCINQYFTKEA